MRLIVSVLGDLQISFEYIHKTVKYIEKIKYFSDRFMQRSYYKS